MFKKILLILFLMNVITMTTFAVGGTYTTNDMFYLPAYGAYGTDEFDEYNTYMEIADNAIKANTDKDLSLYYLKTAIDTQGEMETIWGISIATDTELAALTYSDVGAQQADAALTSISGLTYASPSFTKLTANDTYAVRTLSEVKADLDLEIGTDVLAEQTIGIADDNLVETDHASVADDDYAKFTANGLEGRSYAEVLSDIGAEGDLSDEAGLYSALSDVTEFVEAGDLISTSEIRLTTSDADPDTTAEIKHDSTATGFAGGVLRWFDNDSSRMIVDLETDATNDDYVVAYDADADGFYMKVDADSGAPAWDDITNPDANDEIDMGAYTIELNVEDFQIGDGGGTNVFTFNGNTLSLGGTANIDGVTATEFGYVDGVTSDIQTQLGNKLADVVEDTTPELGGFLDVKEFYLLISDDLGSDHDYSGLVDSAAVGENVVFGDLLYYDWTDTEWKKAKADAIGTTPAQRIALESKSDGQACLMLVQGYIRDDSAFDFGASRIFLNDDTAGTCDDTAPAESGDQIQVVGIAISADKMYFNPSIDVGEI